MFIENKINRFLFVLFLFLSQVLCFCSAKRQNVYRLPLIRHKSTLEKLIYNHRTDEYFKYNTVPPNNENITIFKYLDSQFYANVLVGKPGQKFKVIFDTTWGDMWIPSKLCSETLFPICGKKNLYDSSVSSTHIPIDPKPFNVNGLAGNLTCDSVVLGHLNASALVFAEIREIPSNQNYEMMYADGIIGMGFNTIAKRTTDTPFFYKLLEEKKIAKPIFSLYINRDPTTTKGGIIFLGGIEPKHMKGEMTYVPVTKKAYWQIEMNQFSVPLNKTSSKTFCQNSCQAILDTSSNQIGVPAEYVLEINDLIGAVKYLYGRYVVHDYLVPCSKVVKLPIITLNIGDRDFHVDARHYIQKIENGIINGTICMTAFCDSKLPDNLWSLGGSFLSSVYTTFDLENNRVELAESRN